MAQQDSLQFCPNCGAKLKPGAVFCGNCGFNIANYKASKKNAGNESQASQPASASAAPKSGNRFNQPNQSGSQSNGVIHAGTRAASKPVQSQAASKPKPSAVSSAPTRRTKKTKKWPWITAAIVLIILAGGYMFGKNYYSQDNQLKRAMTSVKKNDKNLAKNFAVSDKQFKLSHKSLQPLIKELKNKPSGMKQFESQLKNNGMTEDGAYSFTPSGRAWLLFPRYKIKAKTFSAKLRTNQPNIKLTVNGQHAYKSTMTSVSHSFGPYIAGQYELTAEGNVHGHHMKNDGNYWLTPSNASDVYLELKTISFTAKGYPGAEVRINNKSYGNLDNTGSLYLQDIPWSNDMELTMVYSGDGGKATSNQRKIHDSDEDEEVSVSFPGVMSHEDAHNLISDVFTDMDLLSASGDVPSDLASLFDDGTSSQQYKDIVSMAKNYNNDKKISSVNFTVQDFHVVPNKNAETKATYNVKYKFYGDSGASHTQVFQYVAVLDGTSTAGKIKSIHATKKISDTSAPGDDDSDSNSDSDSSNNDDSSSDSSDSDSDSTDNSDDSNSDTDSTDNESYQTNQRYVSQNLSYKIGHTE